MVAVASGCGFALGKGHDLGTQRAHDVLDVSPQSGNLAARHLAGACLNDRHAMGRRHDRARKQARCQDDPEHADAKETHVRTIARFGNGVKGLADEIRTPRTPLHYSLSALPGAHHFQLAGNVGVAGVVLQRLAEQTLGFVQVPALEGNSAQDRVGFTAPQGNGAAGLVLGAIQVALVERGLGPFEQSRSLCRGRLGVGAR